MLFVEWVINAISSESPVVSVRSGDQEMANAVEKARASLYAATERFLSGAIDNFSVKFPLSDGNATEHFWLSETSYQDGIFRGTIEDEAKSVTGVNPGDQFDVPYESVTDWTYLKDGKMHGNYSLRALLPRLSPEKATQYASVMAPED